MTTPLRLLLVEDSENDMFLVLRALKSGDYEVSCTRVQTAVNMLHALKEQTWDVVISDYQMPGFNTPAVLQLLKDSGHDLPCVVVSGTIGEEVAVEVMRAGAQDFIMKNNITRLAPAIARELRELTNRKKLRETEQWLQLSQKLEAVGRLAGGVAHDFNNLLTAINSYTEILLGSLTDDSPMRGDLEEIRKAGNRAANLTRQLLAFSRKQILQPKVISLNQIISDLERMLRRLIGEDISLATALKAANSCVKADPGQIEQVIMNLVINARDAMPKGGTMTVETAEVFLDESYTTTHIAVTPGYYVMLAVSDTGCGIEKNILPHIFEPFFTTKGHEKGTGLGLAMIYGIIKQSGGNIWVYSELGLGTSFKIYLPRVDEKTYTANPPKPMARSLQGTETILLVEDEQIIRTLIKNILRKNGYQVLEASDGPQALTLLENHVGALDLVLSDVVMPEMSGQELIKKVLIKFPEVKVLYMSGYTDSAIVHHGMLDPEVDFIQKPFTPDVLSTKIREILEA